LKKRPDPQHDDGHEPRVKETYMDEQTVEVKNPQIVFCLATVAAVVWAHAKEPLTHTEAVKEANKFLTAADEFVNPPAKPAAVSVPSGHVSRTGIA
jgi:hypothetical protein